MDRYPPNKSCLQGVIKYKIPEAACVKIIQYSETPLNSLWSQQNILKFKSVVRFLWVVLMIFTILKLLAVVRDQLLVTLFR